MNDASAVVEDNDQHELLKKHTQALRDAIPSRTRVLDALVSYCRALKQIADAGTAKQLRVREFANQIRSLGAAASALVPAPTVAVGAQAMSFAASTGAELIAAAQAIETNKSLAACAERAKPAVDRLGELLIADMVDIRALLTESIGVMDAGVRSRTKLHRDALDGADLLRARAVYLMEVVATSPENADAAKSELAALIELINGIEHSSRDKIAFIKQRYDEPIAKATAGVRSCDELRTVIAAFTSAHSDFMDALKENQTFSIDTLTDVIERLDKVIDDFKSVETAFGRAR